MYPKLMITDGPVCVTATMVVAHILTNPSLLQHSLRQSLVGGLDLILLMVEELEIFSNFFLNYVADDLETKKLKCCFRLLKSI